MARTDTIRKLTDAETAIVAALDTAVRRDADAPAWLADLRGAAAETFRVHGLPHRRIEAFKYTDVRAAVGAPGALGASREVTLDDLPEAARACRERIVFVDGELRDDLSRIVQGAAVTIRALGDEIIEHPARLARPLGEAPTDPADSLLALNLALARDGAIVRIAHGRESGEPILIVSVTTGRAPEGGHLLHLVHVEDDAHLDLAVLHVNLSAPGAMATSRLKLFVGERARLKLFEANVGADAGTLFRRTEMIVHASADVTLLTIDAGGALTRSEASILFEGPHAKATMAGLGLLARNHHGDLTTDARHAAPDCALTETFRGVLAGKARGVFQGRISVAREAQRTDSKMSAHALMLSDEAEMNTKPELEIFADDVKCGHGATIGALDPEALFYLKSRGIHAPDAMRLLVGGFLEEGLGTIEDTPALAAIAHGIVDAWMADTFGELAP